MKTIAVMNQKGGTGKTTSAINLAGELVRRGKKVLIVDDMISTGGTIIAAAYALREAGAAGISVACTHGVFVNNAIEKFTGSSLDALLSCNTLNNPVSHISVASLIAEAIKDAQKGKW